MEPPGEETKEEPHWELDDKARALAKQQEIQEREADEQRRQQELISAYAHSVARDAANENKDITINDDGSSGGQISGRPFLATW